MRRPQGRGPQLEIRHLQVIESLHRLGTVTKAAASLHLTQPAVSHALREIERRLGGPVVAPNGRGIRLTAAGDRLARRAQALLQSLEQAEEEAVELSRKEESRLRVTTECYTCYHWLPRALAELRRVHPRLEIDLVPEATSRPREAVREREVDLAIVSERREHPDLEYVPLFSDEMVALVAADHPFAERPYLSPEDFRDQHLLLHTDPERSTMIVDVLAPAGVTPARTTKLQLTEAVVETVKAGLGVAVLARWTVAPQLREGKLRAIPITADGLVRRWWAAAPRTTTKAAEIGDLVALLRKGGLD